LEFEIMRTRLHGHPAVFSDAGSEGAGIEGDIFMVRENLFQILL
jgi:hypothetical protein